MPTQRTKEIVIDWHSYEMLKSAAYGMYVANDSINCSGQESAYGSFYDAVQHVMNALCWYDPDFMEIWDSHRIQGSLDISSWETYPEQIKNVLASEGINVIIYI